jgi:GNAT superfamily N-acetyltransferase
VTTTTRTPEHPFTLRSGGPDDARAVLALFDERIAWLAAHGWTGQWGTDPFSSSPRRVEQAQRWCTEGEVRAAEHGGAVQAFVVLGDHHDYVPAPDEPELYVQVLVAASGPAARGAGAVLLDDAARIAAERGLARLRVDCYAGNDGRLVGYYRGQGFEPTETFTVRDWPGQILVRRV